MAEGAAIEREYAPWHERKRDLRARAITPDGAVHWVDAKTIAESPTLQFDNTIFSDNRVLRAPIPGIVAGAVVEYELTVSNLTINYSSGSFPHLVISPFGAHAKAPAPPRLVMPPTSTPR